MCRPDSFSSQQRSIRRRTNYRYESSMEELTDSMDKNVSLDQLCESLSSSKLTPLSNAMRVPQETTNSSGRRSSSSSSSSSQRKRVRFSTKEVREYPLIPDTHSLWESPFQLTLAWNPVATSVVTVKVFRKQVYAQRRTRTSSARPALLTAEERRLKLVRSAQAFFSGQTPAPKKRDSLYARILRKASRRFDAAAQMPLGWDATASNRYR